MMPEDLVVTARGVRFLGRYFPCSLGRSGIRADKVEGDGATPVGAHHIVGMLYRPERLAQPAPWAVPIRPGDLWSDDSADVHYNHMVKVPYDGSHECLRRADPLYDLIMLSDWNWPLSQPGKGSAIFIHQWRRKGFPTEGCVAFRRDHLHWIAGQIVPGTRLIVPGQA